MCHSFLLLLALAVHLAPAYSFSESYTAGGLRSTNANGGVAPLFASSKPDADSKGPITAELFENDETLRGREIAESFAKAKAAVASPSTTQEDTAPEVAEDDAGTSQAATMVMEKAKEELDELKFQVGKIDEERVKQLEAKEAEMQRMKFSLMELKEKVAESERKAKEADSRIQTLQREGEGVKEENKGLIARIKEQFRCVMYMMCARCSVCLWVVCVFVFV